MPRGWRGKGGRKRIPPEERETFGVREMGEIDHATWLAFHSSEDKEES